MDTLKKKNGSKYFTFPSTDEENKEVLKKYAQLLDEIKYLIKTINGDKSGEYGQDFKKIKFKLDDDLPLNKLLKFHTMTIIIRSVFEENEKYPQFF